MHKPFAALFAALLFTIAFASSAIASPPTQVNVRIEGKTGTIFEGPVSAVPHEITSASDTEGPRRCDGINVNNPENTVPAVTPTAVSTDAMDQIGETFDGSWYGQYEDYFLTRWGPDAENPSAPGGGDYWGILVNNTFTNVGGCQYQLDDDDEVFWIYNAFQFRPTLALFPEAASYSSGPRPLTITGVEPGQSVPLEVVSCADSFENNPPASPTRNGSSAYEGAKVSPVSTMVNGFQEIETGTGSTTDAQGKTTVSFTEPGWHRIKATVGTPGKESAIRSNRLDICVTGTGGAALEGASDCGELPAADRVRVTTAAQEAIEREEREAKEAEEKAKDGGPKQGGPDGKSDDTGTLLLSTPRLNRKHLAQGRVGVSWSILEAGPGLKSWMIESRKRSTGRWVVRASGSSKTSTTFRLPKGARYVLRFNVTDNAGKTSTVALGQVKVPRARSHSAR